MQLRVHLLFWLFAACALYLSWAQARWSDHEHVVWGTATALAILVVSVLLHECGHFFTALRFGSDHDLLVLGPFGGLHPPPAPHDPRHEVAVHLAGPLVSAGISFLAGLVVYFRDPAEISGLLHPLAPVGLFAEADTDAVLMVAKLTCWINGLLWLANLLPVFPFDAGRAMRAGIQASRPDFSLRRATLVVTSLAKVLALVSIVLALLLWSDETNEVIPIWFTFMLLALLMYFTARYEEERTVEPPGDDQLFGYDFSEGFTSLERTSSSSTQTETIGPFRRWLEERRQARLQQQRDLEREEEQRVDEILGRLHLHGMQCLSHDERSLLERVSQRYRHRQERSS